MYEFDSGYRREFDQAMPEGKVVALPLKQEASECEGRELFLEQQFEQSVSNLLKYGVLLASAIVLVGGVLYLMRHGAEPADYQFFRGEPSVLCSPVGVVSAVFSGSDRGIIQLGLLILIATPVARVAFSLLAFLRQRDFTYVIVTLFVLAGLMYSLLGAYF